MTEALLLICNRCRPLRSGRSGRDDTEGRRLHRELADQEGWRRRESVEVVEWECLGACDRACAVALRAPGKFTMVLGGVSTAEAAALRELTTLYARSPTGYVVRAERPTSLRRSLVANIPPEPQS